MKKDYIEKRKERLEQKIKLLISKPAFQKDIIELRKKWNIPVNGITNEKDNQNWNQKLLIDTDEYYLKNWPKERKEIIKLRKDKRFREAEELKKKINSQAPLNAIGDDLWSIIIKYKLSPRWHGGIKRYLLFNNPKNMGIEMGITVSMSWEHGIKQISLEIDRDTTLEDIKEVWKWAKKMYKDRQSNKFQPIKKFERDKKIYNLQKDGKTPDEIGNIIEDKFGDYLDYNDINIIVNRFKKRLNIN